MQVNKLSNGGINIYSSDMCGELFQKTFFFYTLAEAKREFKKLLQERNNNLIEYREKVIKHG